MRLNKQTKAESAPQTKMTKGCQCTQAPHWWHFTQTDVCNWSTKNKPRWQKNPSNSKNVEKTQSLPTLCEAYNYIQTQTMIMRHTECILHTQKTQKNTNIYVFLPHREQMSHVFAVEWTRQILSECNMSGMLSKIFAQFELIAKTRIL